MQFRNRFTSLEIEELVKNGQSGLEMSITSYTLLQIRIKAFLPSKCIQKALLTRFMTVMEIMSIQFAEY